MSVDQPIPSSRASRPLAVMVLAAGLGTRMKSDLPKVLHPVCGRPLLGYVLDAAATLGPARLVVVTGPDDDAIEAVLPPGAERVVQAERLGSGDAVRAGMVPLEGFEGDVMVLNGDVPLAGGELLAGLRRHHVDCTARATITTVVLADPIHYGRVVRDANGNVVHIVEARDASPEELARHRDQRRLLRVRRGRAAPLPADSHGRQRPGRVLPDRASCTASSRPATGWPPS